MNIYAVRDRLIDYYLQPFVSPGDKQVLAAMSETINREEGHAIQSAPHQFEVWKLGEVDENTGVITPTRELLATCDSLIRPSVRRSPGEEPRAGANGTTPGGRRDAPGVPREEPGTA